MSIQSVHQTAQSLSYYRRVQEAMANNLANASTHAFKVTRMTAHAGDEALEAVQWTDWRQGAISETQRPLDLALDGPGFLVVQTEQGERLMRGGSLQLDDAGRLTDLDGHVVQGAEGPIVVAGSSVSIAENGNVLVDGSPAGRLRLETVADLKALVHEDGGRYVAQEATQPVAEGSLRVLQGRLEEPNVDTILGMVDLLEVQRAYAANVSALKVIDGVLNIAANEVGKV
jgi:flagellar basal-body rod protein FlgF